jgi:hypothetical protein
MEKSDGTREMKAIKNNPAQIGQVIKSEWLMGESKSALKRRQKRARVK